MSPTAIRRSFEAAEINVIVNDPSVLPDVTNPGIDNLDLTDLVANPRNVLMMAEGGGIFFIADPEVGSGIYEVHTSFLPPFRGAHAINASLAAYRWMFTHTECMTLQTKVPAFNRKAALAARHVGFEPAFERKSVWPTDKGDVDLKFYSMPYETWLRKDAPAMIAAGHAFHTQFEAERERLGVTAPRNHPDEDCHDLRAGVCAEMVYSGQPEKGVALYNRWARFAGYEQIALVARSPLVVDIGDGVLMIQDRTFRVIKCR